MVLIRHILFGAFVKFEKSRTSALEFTKAAHLRIQLLFKVILCSYLILKKINKRITDS